MYSTIRKATLKDIDAVAGIYRKNHDLENAGIVSIGWHSKVYPIRETALDALNAGTLFVMTVDDKVVASGIINQSSHRHIHQWNGVIRHRMIRLAFFISL